MAATTLPTPHHSYRLVISSLIIDACSPIAEYTGQESWEVLEHWWAYLDADGAFSRLRSWEHVLRDARKRKRAEEARRKKEKRVCTEADLALGADNCIDADSAHSEEGGGDDVAMEDVSDVLVYEADRSHDPGAQTLVRCEEGDDDVDGWGDAPESSLAPVADNRMQESAAAVGVESRVEGTGEPDTPLLTPGAEAPLGTEASTHGGGRTPLLSPFLQFIFTLVVFRKFRDSTYNLFGVACQLFRIEVRTGKR